MSGKSHGNVLDKFPILMVKTQLNRNHQKALHIIPGDCVEHITLGHRLRLFVEALWFHFFLAITIPTPDTAWFQVQSCRISSRTQCGRKQRLDSRLSTRKPRNMRKLTKFVESERWIDSLWSKATRHRFVTFRFVVRIFLPQVMRGDGDRVRSPRVSMAAHSFSTVTATSMRTCELPT